MKIQSSIMYSTLLFLVFTPVISISFAADKNTTDKTISKIIVINDQKEAVESQIWLKLKDGNTEYLTTTDANRETSDKVFCKTSQRLFAKPISDAFMFSPIARCASKPDPLTLKVTSMIAMDNLQSSYHIAVAADDNAIAALISNEIAVRMSAQNPTVSTKYRQKTVSYFAEAVNGSSWFKIDTHSDAKVLTQSGQKKLKIYQQSMGITPTGNIDFQTLRSASGTSISSYLFKKRKKI